MPTLPLADCARLLGIHPKTLHSWLKQADVPLAAHPRDARIKCLTEEHVEQLAKLHGRPLQLPATSGLASSEQQALPSSAHEAEALQAVCPLPTSFPQEADVIQKLSCLETKVATRKSTACPTGSGAASSTRAIGPAAPLCARNAHG